MLASLAEAQQTSDPRVADLVQGGKNSSRDTLFLYKGFPNWPAEGGLDRDHFLPGLHLVLADMQADEVFDGGDDVFLGQRALADRQRQAELLVDLVAADLGQVIALGVEVQVLQQGLR